ncbi:MAG: hypothetical protein DRQ88_09750 [Epsilonproteobacteria bacterium]|nr:MAG: hypothetical protein DRQ89_12110 [Campylobacterota bacterium]RLA65168.1 MAG: hypothetical protein DRQ88_09750 [Campylobacterota bacterium]
MKKIGEIMNFKRLGVIPLVLGLLFIASCKDKRSADDLPFVGMGEEGESIVRYVPKGRYIKRFSSVMGDISEKSTEKLDKFEFAESWILKRVSLGLQLVFEVGLTDFFKWEIEPSFELRFEELPKPTAAL